MMITEREIQEIIARCDGIMDYYHNSEQNEASCRVMIEEVRAVGELVAEMILSINGTERLILRPVSDALIGRYGHKLGPRLDGEFFAAFDGMLPRELDSGGPGSAARGDHRRLSED